MDIFISYSPGAERGARLFERVLGVVRPDLKLENRSFDIDDPGFSESFRRSSQTGLFIDSESDLLSLNMDDLLQKQLKAVFISPDVRLDRENSPAFLNRKIIAMKPGDRTFWNIALRRFGVHLEQSVYVVIERSVRRITGEDCLESTFDTDLSIDRGDFRSRGSKFSNYLSRRRSNSSSMLFYSSFRNKELSGSSYNDSDLSNKSKKTFDISFSCYNKHLFSTFVEGASHLRRAPFGAAVLFGGDIKEAYIEDANQAFRNIARSMRPRQRISEILFNPLFKEKKQNVEDCLKGFRTFQCRDERSVFVDVFATYVAENDSYLIYVFDVTQREMDKRRKTMDWRFKELGALTTNFAFWLVDVVERLDRLGKEENSPGSVDSISRDIKTKIEDILIWSNSAETEDGVLSAGELIDTLSSILSVGRCDVFGVIVEKGKRLPELSGNWSAFLTCLISLVRLVATKLQDKFAEAGNAVKLLAFRKLRAELDFTASRGLAERGVYLQIDIRRLGENGVGSESCELLDIRGLENEPVDPAAPLQSLRLADAVVRDAGGVIKIARRGDETAGFSVILPAHEADAADIKDQSEYRAWGAFPAFEGRGSVLIASRDPFADTILRRVLQAVGLNAVIASEVGDVADIVQASDQDVRLIINALESDELTIDDFSETLQGLGLDIPVLRILDDARFENRKGAAMALPRSYTTQQLIEAIARVLTEQPG